MQFLRVWKNFPPPPSGNSTIIFAPGGRGIRHKIVRVAGIRSLKKFSRGLPGGGGRCIQLALTETLQLYQLLFGSFRSELFYSFFLSLFSLKFCHSAEPIQGLSYDPLHWDYTRFLIVWAGVFLPICFFVVSPWLVLLLRFFISYTVYCTAYTVYCTALIYSGIIFLGGGGGGGLQRRQCPLLPA